MNCLLRQSFLSKTGKCKAQKLIIYIGIEDNAAMSQWKQIWSTYLITDGYINLSICKGFEYIDNIEVDSDQKVFDRIRETTSC